MQAKSETYIMQLPDGSIKHCLFPDGLNVNNRCTYFLFESMPLLRRGDLNYDETHITLRGLEILILDLRTTFVLEAYSTAKFKPIYVISTHHFINRSIRYREGQQYIYGTEYIWRKDSIAKGIDLFKYFCFFPHPAFAFSTEIIEACLSLFLVCLYVCMYVYVSLYIHAYLYVFFVFKLT